MIRLRPAVPADADFIVSLLADDDYAFFAVNRVPTAVVGRILGPRWHPTPGSGRTTPGRISWMR
jgi:hypothetical protein